MEGQNYASSKSLKALQDDLKKLSEELNETYELLLSNEKEVGESWQDNKFDEFEDEFSKKRELLSELSEKYKGWADNYLPKYIDAAIIHEGGNVTLGK